MEEILTQCTSGGAVRVHVKDGVITRIRPYIFDDTDAPPWTIEARGRTFTAPRKTTMMPYVSGEKARIYSDQRIKYPMKRVDWDPNGERNTQNRGISGHQRITWDEALDLVAGEIKRVRETYGPEAVAATAASHHNWGLLFYKMGPFGRFFNMLGYTEVADNPDSWEGWHWGATHTWGYYWRLGVSDCYDMLEDALQNTDQVIMWSSDPNTTTGYPGQDSLRWRIWCKELGIKLIFIDPFCNFTAAMLGDKWYAPRPGTDTALAEAIAYVWIKEGTYDKWFVENRTVGFEEFEKRILGGEDGVERTPEWAAELTGLPARDIKALAREWAAHKTMLGVGSMVGLGGACRAAYGHEWARLMVLLLAMQGLGKPGVNTWGGAGMAPPLDYSFYFPGYSSAGWDAFNLCKDSTRAVNKVTQKLYRILLPDCFLNPPVTWRGEGFCGNSLEQQFTTHTYPEPGCSEVHLLYRHGGSYISTMCETSKFVDMYQSPKIECVVAQDCHWQSETSYADVILPASTQFEQSDISEWMNPGGYAENKSGTNYRMIVYQKKCIEPLWESKPDWDIYCALAERLGFLDEYTEKCTREDWIKRLFYSTSLCEHVEYEDFKKKGYFLVPPPKSDYKRTVSNRWFYEGRTWDVPDRNNPMMYKDRNPRNQDPSNWEPSDKLGTYSGKIEFVSQSLAAHEPDDKERPLIPQYIPSWEGHLSEKAKDYPLQIITPHARFSFHTHYDNKVPWLDEIPANRIIKNGYAYWPLRINPVDAAERAIQNNDIVKVYNERGSVLCVAVITERVPPGVLHSYQAAAKYDPLDPGNARSTDRGGCLNILSPGRMMSKNVPGEAQNSTLVEVCRGDV
ncbi:MAG: molybdopterin-dependent oxidoreductase [Thermoleophilia bacterium]|jgi:molybdopterin guanine dinucleotide-containing S/N-oxide reductase-like protein